MLGYLPILPNEYSPTSPREFNVPGGAIFISLHNTTQLYMLAHAVNIKIPIPYSSPAFANTPGIPIVPTPTMEHMIEMNTV